MRHFHNRITNRWNQFSIEVSENIRGLQVLVVCLAFIGKIKPTSEVSFTVIVDSWREAIILRFFQSLLLLNRYEIIVIRSYYECDFLLQTDLRDPSIMIVTSRAFIKYYQSLVTLRHQGKLVVL